MKIFCSESSIEQAISEKRLNCFEVTISNTNIKFNGLKWATSRFSEVQFNNEYDILEPLPKLFQCKNIEFRSNTFKMRDYKILLMRNFVHVSELFLTFLEDLKWYRHWGLPLAIPTYNDIFFLASWGVVVSGLHCI